MTSFRIFIDRQTGTWGMASDLVIATVPESQVNDMETMSDSEIIEVAYQLEWVAHTLQQISSPDLHPESE
jgi:hypothetical protein